MPSDPAPSPSFAPAETVCRVAVDADERAVHHRIREAVFVAEQGLFAGTDIDPHDADPRTLHVLALSSGEAAGTVRLYPLDEPGIWKGDRLAVLPPFRRHGLGAPLVRFAVTTAAACGGRQMVAHIQPPNVALFDRLGWQRVGGLEEYVGRPHQRMAIDLR